MYSSIIHTHMPPDLIDYASRPRCPYHVGEGYYAVSRINAINTGEPFSSTIFGERRAVRKRDPVGFAGTVSLLILE